MSEIIRAQPVLDPFELSGRCPNPLILSLVCGLLSTCGYVAGGAELLTLSPENYDRYAPQGNEVDAIFGDYVLRNDRITVVVANPNLTTGRSSSRWAIAHVAGCVIDIAQHDHPGEALTAFYPGVTRYKPDAPQRQQDFVEPESFAKRADRKAISGKEVRLTIPEIELGSRRALADLVKLPPSQRGAPSPTMRVRYTLADDWDAVKIETIYRNPSTASFKWQPHCVLRVDPASEAGNGIVRTGVGRAENLGDEKAQFCWSYDRWFRQACGVLTLSSGIDSKLIIPTQLRSEVGQITLLPGGQYRVTRWLIAGRDVFAIKAIANELLQREARTVRLLTSDGESSVPNVFVTAKLGEVDYASGWTDDNGTLDMSLPVLAKRTNNRWTLHLQPTGVNSTSVKLSPDTEPILKVRVKKAARLVARVVDETDSPIPCRLRLRGVGDTADPDFFPATGETAVRNALHLTDGRIDHPIAIGQYDVAITRGPEHDAVVRRIIVEPSERVLVNATLKRVVQTPGWISADLHNHSTVTGATDRFYIKGYRKNTTVDGDSTASQLGRIRNLLAEHIEFAVPTEHNQVSSFDSPIKRLGAEKFIATVPGVGLTAGRRHTLTHQNTFPVPFRRGDLDGGMLQRPQHIGQVDWLNRWKTATERFVQIMFPQGTKLFINRKMDAVEIESLEPLIGDSLAGESRVLEWLDRLREGYRIPAVLNSGAFDNYPGCGRQRTYIRNQTDDPAAFRRSGLLPQPSLDQKGLVGARDPIHGLVANAKAGHLLLTNGPFLEVSLRSSDGDVVALPGDSIRAESGTVTLEVRVQSSNQYDIDRIQVLINGRRDAAFDFRKDSHADFFHTGVMKFQRELPLNLNEDAFVIVVASGHALPLAIRDQTRPAIAMTNPIWIDVTENGYRPHSPLDDRVETRLQFLRPLLARTNATPGRVRVNLRNHGDQIARDSIRLDFDPPDAIEVIGTRDRTYAIPPSGETFIDFEIRLANDYLATGLPIIPNTYVDKNLGIRTLRSSKGQGRTPGSTRVHVDHSGMRLPNLKILANVPAALRSRLVFPIRSRHKEHLADIQFADAGEHLAVLAKVHDANVIREKIAWQGSCLEIYGAMPKQKPIGRILLTPKVGKHKTAAHRIENGRIVASAEIACESRPTASGYQLWALVPWKLLPVEPRAEQVLLEFRVSTATAKGGPHQRTDLFRAGAPHVDHGLYGRIRFEGQVGAELATLKLFGNKRHAQIRLHLKNRTQQTLRDRVNLRLTPSGLAQFAEQSESSGTTTVHYNLEPKAETTREFNLNLLPDANAARLRVEVEDSPAGQVIAVQPLEMQVTEHRLPQIVGVTRLEDIQAGLGDIPPWLMFAGDRILTRLRFAASGSHLALSAEMIDPAPQPHETAWKGSCLEIFGAPLKQKEPATFPIGQLFLTPGTASKPANGSRQSERLQVKEPNIKVRSKPIKSGYLLEALIPLELLHLSSTTGGRLEFQSTVFSNRAGKDVTRTTLFGSERAYQNATSYGQFSITP